MMLAKFLLLALLLGTLNNLACAQSNLIDVTDQKDILIDIERVGKIGKTKKYFIQTGNKSIEPPLPNTYRIFEKKYYKIETDAIAYGQTILTFKIPANQEDFTKVRILHLTAWELNPRGFEWEDCTITEGRLVDPKSESYSAKANDRLKKFLPDLSQKIVSCELGAQMKPEEFFVVTVQSQMPPTEPFTKITWELESKLLPSKNGGISYKLTFTNAGAKDIGEFNFRSVFDTDTKLNSFKLSQGTCNASTYGSSFGSVVCHAGQILVGKSVAFEIEGEDSAMAGNLMAGSKKNENWDIQGYFKDSPNDPVWEANGIWFRPLSKTDLLKK